MNRKLVVTLEIDVADLTDTERRELATGLCFDGEDPSDVEADLPSVADTDPRDIAHVLTALKHDYAQEELWGGSEVFAKFADVKVRSAEWTQ